MKQLKKSSQSGRSMTEMVGVLGIIGLLSIGSVVGYEQGMALYSAGSIRDSLFKARTLAKTSTSAATAAEVRRLLKNDMIKYGAAVSSQSDGYNRSYTIDIGYVSPRVCRIVFSKADMLNSQGIEITQPTALAACNETTGTSETTQMTFSFNAN